MQQNADFGGERETHKNQFMHPFLRLAAKESEGKAIDAQSPFVKASEEKSTADLFKLL